MPRLETIHIADFRNIEEASLTFSPNVNCIVGGNSSAFSPLIIFILIFIFVFFIISIFIFIII